MAEPEPLPQPAFQDQEEPMPQVQANAPIELQEVVAPIIDQDEGHDRQEHQGEQQDERKDSDEEDADEEYLWNVEEECQDLQESVTLTFPRSDVESKTRFSLSRNLFKYAKNDP